jgi:putative ABC transport system permease protein
MAALVVAVSVTVGLGIMITSFRSTVTRWLDGTLQSDIYVSIPGLVSSRAQGTLDPSLVQRLTTGPGVDGFSTYRESPGNPAGGMVRLVALELDPRGEAGFHPVQAWRSRIRLGTSRLSETLLGGGFG